MDSAYFIPDIYAEQAYMICPQVTGWRCESMHGEITVQVGDLLVVEGQRMCVEALLGEIADADDGRIVEPLIVALRRKSRHMVHYALYEIAQMDVRNS
jgi:hypothetical protein